MEKRFKLIKEIPWLKKNTIIQFDTEYEEIWIEDEDNWYKQPTNWQYSMLLELVKWNNTDWLVEIE